ncbi:MAG: cupin domain-containing protein [Gammaproteobacteria bacterium]|nr:cupin domain-containing protein [Gammaproteobacteria bacterium]
MKVIKAIDSPFVRSPDDAFTSFRLLTEKDHMGFTVCKTVIPKGGPWNWHYTNHQEACYCIQGHGTLTDLETGEAYQVGPDSMYVLPKHENHTFEAFTDVILISVFNPPLRGDECHKEDGSYE